MKNIKSFLKKHNVVFIVLTFLILTKFTCFVKLITGFPCPFCGMTRACLSLIHFKFLDAWNYHPLFWLIIPVLFFIITKKPLFKSTKKQIIFFIIIFSIVISVYVYRMIKLFPDIPPMDYNKNSLLYSLIIKIKIIIKNFVIKG